MTPADLAAFHAGLRHAASLAQIAALTLEIRPEAADMRQRAAIEALRGLADGLKGDAGESRIGVVDTTPTPADRVGDVETSPSPLRQGQVRDRCARSEGRARIETQVGQRRCLGNQALRPVGRPGED